MHADLVRDALYGRLGDLSESVHGPAVLFALDRRDAAPEIRDLLAGHDVLLLDRYVTSNAAYGSARLGGPDRPTPASPTGSAQLEVDRFGVPLPDQQILLATPLAVAAERARDRAADNAIGRWTVSRQMPACSERTAAMYRLLADTALPVTVDGADTGSRRVAQYPGLRIEPRLIRPQVVHRGGGHRNASVEVLGADPDVDVQHRD